MSHGQIIVDLTETHVVVMNAINLAIRNAQEQITKNKEHPYIENAKNNIIFYEESLKRLTEAKQELNRAIDNPQVYPSTAQTF